MLTLSEVSLVNKANRKLSTEGLRIKRCPQNSRWFNELGRFYIVDLDSNLVIAKDICITDELF